jgi:hypothetical protein
LLLHFSHPVFHILSFWINDPVEANSLSFGAEHRHDCFFAFWVEFNFINVFEDFVQVGLDGQWFFRLRQYFEEFIVGQKVKTGEFGSFRLQIIVERLLNDVKCSVVVSDFVKKLINLADHLDVDELSGLADDRPPEIVGSFEVFTFFMKLFGDVRRIKDRLEVHPVDLKLCPLLHDV